MKEKLIKVRDDAFQSMHNEKGIILLAVCAMIGVAAFLALAAYEYIYFDMWEFMGKSGW